MAKLTIELPKSAVKAFQEAVYQLERCGISQIDFIPIPSEEEDPNNDGGDNNNASKKASPATSSNNIGNARYSISSLTAQISENRDSQEYRILKELTDEFKVPSIHHLTDNQVLPFLYELNSRLYRASTNV